MARELGRGSLGAGDQPTDGLVVDVHPPVSGCVEGQTWARPVKALSQASARRGRPCLSSSIRVSGEGVPAQKVQMLEADGLGSCPAC
jgi:hypothetical protein